MPGRSPVGVHAECLLGDACAGCSSTAERVVAAQILRDVGVVVPGVTVAHTGRPPSSGRT